MRHAGTNTHTQAHINTRTGAHTDTNSDINTNTNTHTNTNTMKTLVKEKWDREVGRKQVAAESVSEL